jgi:hypothetical protein
MTAKRRGRPVRDTEREDRQARAVVDCWLRENQVLDSTALTLESLMGHTSSVVRVKRPASPSE